MRGFRSMQNSVLNKTEWILTNLNTFDWPFSSRNQQLCNIHLKGIVHPKIKIAPWFTHPQAIRGVYDFLFRWIQSEFYKKQKILAFAHPSHPSCLYYYSLSPIYCFCTSYLFLHILLVFAHLTCFCTSYLFLHILLVFAHLTCFCTSYLSCTSCFALFFILLHILLFIYFFYLYICSCVVLLLYNLYSLHCPLSGPDLNYISLLIIPCIIYHVTNKETLNLEPWSPKNCIHTT